MVRLSVLTRVIFLTVFTAILLSTAAWGATEVVLYSFCQKSNCADGAYPNGSLIFDTAGNLYGTTTGGGANPNGGGVVFELSPSPSGWTETVLYSFCAQASCADGETPEGALMFDSLGNIYGTTASGGANGHGTVYELSPSASGWTETVLYSFCPESVLCSASNSYFDTTPGAGVVMDNEGNLFGTTYYDGIFELSPSSGGYTETRLYEVGNYTPAGVALDAAGDVYGVAEQGGINAYPGGYVFELSRAGAWAANTLFGFPKNTAGEYADGYNPISTPVFDNAGHLYGTTQYNGVLVNGGNLIGGTAYKLTKTKKGWAFEKLHTFNGKKDGAQPIGPLAVDSSGSVYGTTFAGGTGDCQGSASYCGTVFKIALTSGKYTESVLWNFGSAKDGWHPTSGVILDGAGNLYGTTYYGGTGTWSNGVVFEVMPSGAATATTTALTSSPNPSTSGEDVTFTAVVTPGPPDGEAVNFMKGLTVLGAGSLRGGSASFATSTLVVGTASVKAVYGGDGDFIASTSNVVKQVVKK